MWSVRRSLLIWIGFSVALSGRAAAATGELPYCVWQARDFAIELPLCGLIGDPANGRALAADSHAGNCLACHQMPIPEEPFMARSGRH